MCWLAPARKGCWRQRGLSILEVMLILLLISSALVAAYLGLRASAPAQQATEQSRELEQADEFLIAFVAANNRLPCPDVDNDGVEDCNSSAQKGRLPYRTLGMEGTQFSPGLGKLQYLVQRTASVDLTQLANLNNLFEPIGLNSDATPPDFSGQWAGNNAPLKNYGTTADFCQGLVNGAAQTLTSAQAQAHGPNGAIALAYALVHPGTRDADGDGNFFDGYNATDPNGVDARSRSASPTTYDDQVYYRNYRSLETALDCPRFIASENGVALAAQVIDDVKSIKEANIQSAKQAIATNVVSALLTTWTAITAGTEIATAITGIATSSAALAAAIASCIVLVGCAEIPVWTAALAAFTSAQVAATIAAVASGVAIAGYVAAAAWSAWVMVQAGGSTGETPAIDLDAAIAQAQANYQTAVSAAAKAQTDLNKANSGLDNATSQYQSDLNRLNSALNLPPNTVLCGDSPTFTTLFTQLQAAAQALLSAQNNLAQAKQAYDQAKLYNSTTPPPALDNSATIKALQDQLDNTPPSDTATRTALQNQIDLLKNPPPPSTTSSQVGQITTQIDSLTAQINDTQTQISNTTDPTQLANLTAQLTSLQDQRSQLQGQLATLTPDLSVAQQNYDNAVQAQTDAQTAYNTARKNIDASVDQGFAVYCDADGKPVGAVIFDKGAISQVLTALYGGPDLLKGGYLADGSYFKLQRATEAQQSAADQKGKADQQVTQQQETLDNLRAMATGGASFSGDMNHIFEGGDAILNAVDLRGGIQ